jgi:hypothetical protein
VFSICGISFKTVAKAFQLKLVERMPRAVIKAKGGYFDRFKIYFDVFNTFGSYMILCVIS